MKLLIVELCNETILKLSAALQLQLQLHSSHLCSDADGKVRSQKLWLGWLAGVIN